MLGTYVATMTATDADEAGSDNSKIVYSILSQEPAGSESVFAINERTGAITIKRPILDREVKLALNTLTAKCGMLANCLRFMHDLL